MNTDLISREALKKAITEATYNFEQIPIRVDKVQEIIDNAPTVEGPKYILKIKNLTAEKKKRFQEEWNKSAGGLLAIPDNYELIPIERPQGEWSPVSERLPNERINPNTMDFEYVLCSTIWNDVRAYKYGKPIGHDKAHFWYGDGIMDEYVTAWQPLPEPYKEGGES